jgi:hypothetical protein
MDLRPGEKVMVLRRDIDSQLVQRYKKIRQPLKHLIGKRQYRRRVSIEELEEKIEAR